MSNEFTFIEVFLSSVVGFLLFSLVSYSTLLASRQILIFNFFLAFQKSLRGWLTPASLPNPLILCHHINCHLNYIEALFYNLLLAQKFLWFVVVHC